MLGLTEAQRAFLLNARHRTPYVRVDISDIATGRLVRSIRSSPTDPKEANRLAIVGGNVRADRAAGVLRSLSLDLVDPLHEVGLGIGQLIGLDKLFTVFKGYRIPAPWGDGSVVWWPLGAFVLNGRPGIGSAGDKRIIRIQGGDKSCLANKSPRGGFRTAMTLQAGLTKKAALQLLAQLDTWNEKSLNFTPESTATLPQDYPCETTDSPWAVAQRIAGIVEPDGRITRLEYDPWGALVLRMDPGPDLSKLAPVWTAKVPTTKAKNPAQLITADMEIDYDGFANAIRVNYGSSRTGTGSVLVYDDNPASPTYVGKVGWYIREWLNGQQDELIRTADEARIRGLYELRAALAYQQRVPLTLVENPALEPGDVAEAAAPQADVSGNYQLESLSIDLGASGRMTADGRRVTQIGA